MEFIETNTESKIWAAFCHIVAFVGFAVPFGNIISVVIVWLLKRHESDFVNRNGKASINFQILCSLVFAVYLLPLPFGIGLIIALLFGIFAITEIVLAAIRANQGLVYKYRYALRLLK